MQGYRTAHKTTITFEPIANPGVSKFLTSVICWEATQNSLKTVMIMVYLVTEYSLKSAKKRESCAKYRTFQTWSFQLSFPPIDLYVTVCM